MSQFGEKVEGYDVLVFNEREVRNFSPRTKLQTRQVPCPEFA